MEKRNMKPIRRAIHLDFHTMPGIVDFGRDFDAEEFARTLAEAKVDYINVFARCNIGYSYYRTRVGIPYPGMKGDMLGEMIEALHRQGIGLSAYLNAGLHHIRAGENRGWCKVNERGQIMTDDRMDNFFRTLCYNTEYGEYLAAEVEEVVKGYDVDGIFLDCIGDAPCYGQECIEEMGRRGIDTNDPEAVRRFAQQTNLEYFTRLRKLVPSDRRFFLNSLLYPEYVSLLSHDEIECLPTGGWGYDFLPANAHYVRNFGLETLNMSGRFHKSWADFGGLRTRDSLEYDLYYGLANGLIPSVGDHLHPRGKLEKPVYDMIGAIYGELESLEPWTTDARPMAEAAVVVPVGLYERPCSRPGVNGAARLLDELHIQYDILDARRSFSAYRVVILPDDVLIDDGLAEKLSEYLAAGGRVVSSGRSGLDPEEKSFRLPEWDFDYEGAEPNNIGYFRAVAPLDKGIADMDTAAYGSGIAMRARRQEQVGAWLVSPYFDYHWDGLQAYFYVPPKASAGLAAICRTERVCHVSFPIFKNYYESAYLAHKSLFANILDEMLGKPLVQAENLPSFGRVFLTRKEELVMAHVLCYCPEVRGKTTVIEDTATIKDVTLRVRAGNVRRAYLAPEGTPLPLKKAEDAVEVRIPEIRGYRLAVFERI
jgi:hypothetical protein